MRIQLYFSEGKGEGGYDSVVQGQDELNIYHFRNPGTALCRRGKKVNLGQRKGITVLHGGKEIKGVFSREKILPRRAKGL